MGDAVFAIALCGECSGSGNPRGVESAAARAVVRSDAEYTVRNFASPEATVTHQPGALAFPPRGRRGRPRPEDLGAARHPWPPPAA